MNLKNRLMALTMSIAAFGLAAVPMHVDAKRLGSGRPAGMQRQMPANQPGNVPAKPAQPTNAANPSPAAAAAPAAAAPKRSWMGPLAGLAAGLGIAALMSHLGMGEAFGNFLTMALVALVGFMVVAWLVRRFGGARMAQAGPQLAGAGAGAPYNAPMQREAIPTPHNPAPVAGFSGGSAPAAGAAASLANVPAGFDVDGFQRIAKMIFIRMQAANDAGNLDDLRKFTTPELFASIRLDLQERGQAANQTDVMQLDAELVDTAKEDGQWIVSVRFHGLIREEVGAGANPFNELWHLVKPVDDSRDWAIAGITPLDA